MANLKINKDFCYDSNKTVSVFVLNQALENYSNKLSDAIKLSGNIPIIPDTNVLLNYYGMSNQDKKQLLQFFEKNKDRIYLTKQVEEEFLRNRISTINNIESPNKITSDYIEICSKIINLYRNFLNNRKKLISKDYPKIWIDLTEKQEKLEEIFEGDFKEDLIKETGLNKKIKEAIEESKKNNENINSYDKLIAVCSQFRVLPSLDDDEIEFIKQQYESLCNKYEETPNNRKREAIFPGYGDKGKKEQQLNPYGDFIIFHEILKFMKSGVFEVKEVGDNISNSSEFQSTDVIFLTYEKNKEDWIYEDMSPIIHYIEKAYLNTEKALFVIKAERALDISFENIHQTEEVEIEPDPNLIRESTIYSLNTELGWGFIKSPKYNNLYFKHEFMKETEDFYDLKEKDVVRYQIGKNKDGGNIAINVEKISYSFDDENFSIIESKIVRKSGRYGFVKASPENLYFHHQSVVGNTSFDDLKEEDQVQYIEGKNDEGKNIARLVKKIE